MSEFRRFLFAVLLLLIAPLLGVIGVRLAKFDWLNFPEIWLAIPIIFLVIAILWIIKRYKDLHNSNIGGLVIRGENWIPRWRYPYDGVMWNVISTYVIRERSDLDTRTPPLCPHCGTELEQTKNLLYGYTWSCIRGDFKKRSKLSYFVVAKKVTKLAFNDYERGRLTI